MALPPLSVALPLAKRKIEVNLEVLSAVAGGGRQSVENRRVDEQS